MNPLQKSQSHCIYPNYGQPELVIERGAGSRLWDSENKEYIDFFAGIAVSTLGHAHPKLVQALTDQAQKLIHLSNYYFTAPNLELAARLVELSGLDRAFFCNSGTEANEAALKLVRRHFFDRQQPERFEVIAFDNSFHGRTLGSLTATGQPKYREGFGPIGGVKHLPFGDLDAVEEAMNPQVAAIIVEAIQGEGGVNPAPEGFLKGLRELTQKNGSFLIIDEVQTGIGRTGTYFAVEQETIQPDVITVAKGLGSGLPIGGFLCTEELSQSLPPGSHGSTFGGNPLCSVAALTTLAVLEEEKILERVNQMGQKLAQRLATMAEKYPVISHQRGRGYMQALVLKDGLSPAPYVAACREAGLLLTAAGGCALRITPPLTISDEELESGLNRLDQVLESHS